MPDIERIHLRTKVAAEDKLIADDVSGLSAAELAAAADEWIVHALNVLYDPNRRERITEARRALIKAHSRAAAAAREV